MATYHQRLNQTFHTSLYHQIMKKIFKRLLQFIGVLLLLLLIGFGVLYAMYNTPLPTGQAGTEAEALKEKIYKAVNKAAWDQTRYIQWTFIGRHDYLWDRERNLVEVKWGSTRVLLDPGKKSGAIYEGGTLQAPNEGTFNTAYRNFINDAFWLNAFVQMDDATLQVIESDYQEEALLVTYPSGGVTPGDSYLWILGEDGLPKSWQMWVTIIPIGGIPTTWENWTTLPTGAKVAQNHVMGPMDVTITNLKSFQTL